MKEHFLYNFEDKMLVTFLGGVLDLRFPIVLGIGFCIGSVVTYLMTKRNYEK